MTPGTRESASGCPELRSAGTGPFGRRDGCFPQRNSFVHASTHPDLCDLSRLPSETLLHAILYWRCYSSVTHA
jgi:hypothetical protein